MSANVRALLKAKTKERQTRLEHPYAAYNATGQLRCTVCAMVIKNEAAWEGHLGSKGHRANVGRLKELERKEEEKRREKGKRKADNQGDVQMEDDHVSKRARTAEPPDPALAQSNSSFPTDFFSDRNRAIPISNDDGEDGEPPGTTPNPIVNPQLDLEWAQFEREVLAAPATEDQGRDIYARATLIAEPQLAEDTLFEGFPPSTVAPSRGTVNGAAKPTLEPEEEEQTRKKIEEKELIMDRILDEERAQEDADERVAALKARLVAVKAKRVAAKAKLQDLKNGES